MECLVTRSVEALAPVVRKVTRQCLVAGAQQLAVAVADASRVYAVPRERLANYRRLDTRRNEPQPHVVVVGTQRTALVERSGGIQHRTSHKRTCPDEVSLHDLGGERGR